jgi:allantoinase
MAIQSRRVVTPEGVRPAAIRIRGERITAVGMHGAVPPGMRVEDHGNSVIMPGLVDTHVHVNEPGRTEWEGFETATRAAAAGGVTTLLDMPLNSVPPTTTAAGLRVKREAAQGQCHVDVGFWGGVVPENLLELPPLLEQGVFGFKAFLVHSGVPEFGHVSPEQLRAALSHLAGRKIPLLIHAELAALVREPASGSYGDYLASRPRTAEREAVIILARMCKETGGRAHVVHLSASDAVADLRRARAEGARLSAETCPHYLFFGAEDVPRGATELKCAPPIREGANRARLWEALEDGTLEMIVSDHSPAPPASKRRESGDFRKAWGGIASLELSLRASWTAGKARGVTLPQLARWLSSGPARMAGLDRKGSIAPGFDADLVVWNPEARSAVDPAALHQRHKLTPYAGRELDGAIETTYLRGAKVFERGAVLGKPRGELLARVESR